MKNRNVKNGVNSVVYFVDLPGSPKSPISVDNEKVSKDNMDMLLATLRECKDYTRYLSDILMDVYTDIMNKDIKAEDLYLSYCRERDNKDGVNHD